MVEEDNEKAAKELNEAVKESRAEDKIEDIQEKSSKIAKNLENIYAERLKNKQLELDAMDKQIEKKINDFKDFLAKTEISGRGQAMIERTEEDLKKELSEAKVKEIMRAVGR